MRNISLSLFRSEIAASSLHRVVVALPLSSPRRSVTIGGCHEVWMSRQHNDDKTTKNVDDTIVRRETARDGEKGDDTKKQRTTTKQSTTTS